MIREWAREQGMTVGDRGVLPRHVVEAYKRAHGISPRITVRKGLGSRWRVTTGNPLDDVAASTWREAWDYAVTIAISRMST